MYTSFLPKPINQLVEHSAAELMGSATSTTASSEASTCFHPLLGFDYGLVRMSSSMFNNINNIEIKGGVFTMENQIVSTIYQSNLGSTPIG